MQKLVVVFLCTAMVAGCGTPRMAPVAPQAVGDLKPEVKDANGGMVGTRPGFSPTTFTEIIVTPFAISTAEIKGDKDSRLAKDMTAHLQSQLVKKLQAAGIFAKVIDATASPEVSGSGKILRLEGDITAITEGSEAGRKLIGFGLGSAKVRIESRLLDMESQRIELVTTDSRSAGMSGKNGKPFVVESICQMAGGYVKMLTHLSGGGHPGVMPSTHCSPASDWPVAPESRVRILASGLGDKKQIGIAVSFTQDTLFFRQDKQTNIRGISVRDIRQLEIAQGTHTQMRKGLLIGGAIGLVAGGVIGATTYDPPPPCQAFICIEETRRWRAFVGGLLGLAAGELIGTIIGAQATDTWVPVSMPSSMPRSR